MAYIGPFRNGWRVQIQRDGQRVTKTFKTKREAQAWATEIESRKTPVRSNTLGQAIKHYLATVSTQKRNAVDWEKRRFDALLEYFGNIPLSDIDSEKLGRWRDFRLQTVKGSTVLREVNLYRNLFKIAKSEWKWIHEVPFDGVRLPKDEPPREKVWRAPQIWRIIHAGKKSGGKTWEVVQAFHIALRTGMRLQEAISAPAGFDRVRRVVDLPPTKTAPKGESVPLTKWGYRLMLKMPRFEVEPNEASTLFSRLCKQNLIEGLEFRDSRATALTLLSRKVDILTLSRISRHKNLDLLRSTYYRETAEEISRRL